MPTRDPFTPGALAVVSKPGSSHNGWTVKVLSITGTGRSYRVSLGAGGVRTYLTENLRPYSD
jgi:hypothetical protein